MKMTINSKNFGFASLGVFVLALLWFAPAAQACCTPCNPWCKTLPPDAYCCTGIPQPANACGLTICGKYLQMSDGAVDTALFQPPTMSLATVDSCDQQPPALVASAEEAAEATPREEAES